MSDRYTDFFLNSRADAPELDLLEITHPAFTQAYRIVRNARDGLVVDLPADPPIGAMPATAFIYRPVRVRRLAQSDDLDSAISIDLGDLGEVLPIEVDAVAEAGAFLIKPKVRYWSYRGDDLSAPIFGPIHLEVGNFAHNAEGVSFDAKAPQLNANRTGQLYRLETFPMLRGTI
jgi:hypothetical protein